MSFMAASPKSTLVSAAATGALGAWRVGSVTAQDRRRAPRWRRTTSAICVRAKCGWRS